MMVVVVCGWPYLKATENSGKWSPDVTDMQAATKIVQHGQTNAFLKVICHVSGKHKETPHCKAAWKQEQITARSEPRQEFSIHNPIMLERTA